MSLWKIATISLVLSLNTCDNIYKPYNDPQSDKYRYDKARNAIDKSEFTEAIELLYPIWVGDKTKENIAYYYAVAHAGRAGLNIIDLIAHLSEELDDNTLFASMASFFEDIDSSHIYDINEAIRIIEFTSETPTERSGRMNFLTLFANWARIGLVISRYAYSGNELLSSSFDACKISSDKNGARTGLPDVGVDEIMISVPRILELATLISGTSDVLDTLLDTSFSTLVGVSKSPLPCENNSNHASCLAVRTLINLGPGDSNEAIGLDTGNFTENPTGLCAATYN